MKLLMGHNMNNDSLASRVARIEKTIQEIKTPQPTRSDSNKVYRYSTSNLGFSSDSSERKYYKVSFIPVLDQNSNDVFCNFVVSDSQAVQYAPYMFVSIDNPYVGYIVVIGDNLYPSDLNIFRISCIASCKGSLEIKSITEAEYNAALQS